MAPYFEHMHSKSTHERRTHAMRVAGVITALLFAGWISTLGLRSTLGTGQPQVAGSDGSSQTAAALNTQIDQGYQGNQLVVATSSDN